MKLEPNNEAANAKRLLSAPSSNSLVPVAVRFIPTGSRASVAAEQPDCDSHSTTVACPQTDACPVSVWLLCPFQSRLGSALVCGVAVSVDGGVQMFLQHHQLDLGTASLFGRWSTTTARLANFDFARSCADLAVRPLAPVAARAVEDLAPRGRTKSLAPAATAGAVATKGRPSRRRGLASEAARRFRCIFPSRLSLTLGCLCALLPPNGSTVEDISEVEAKRNHHR